MQGPPVGGSCPSADKAGAVAFGDTVGGGLGGLHKG